MGCVWWLWKSWVSHGVHGGRVGAVREVRVACGGHGVHVDCIWVVYGGCGSREEGAG